MVDDLVVQIDFKAAQDEAEYDLRQHQFPDGFVCDCPQCNAARAYLDMVAERDLYTKLAENGTQYLQGLEAQIAAMSAEQDEAQKAYARLLKYTDGIEDHLAWHYAQLAASEATLTDMRMKWSAAEIVRDQAIDRLNRSGVARGRLREALEKMSKEPGIGVMAQRMAREALSKKEVDSDAKEE